MLNWAVGGLESAHALLLLCDLGKDPPPVFGSLFPICKVRALA